MEQKKPHEGQYEEERHKAHVTLDKIFDLVSREQAEMVTAKLEGILASLEHWLSLGS